MSDFKAARKSLSHRQRLEGSKEDIFPLLCPTREYDWIKEWSCELVYSESGFAEPNCVFRTEGAVSRISGAPEEIWIVSRHEAPTRIEFVKFAAGLFVIKYEIDLVASADGGVTATWTQHFTALAEAGNRRIAALTQENYSTVMQALEAKMNYYLRHGECMP